MKTKPSPHVWRLLHSGCGLATWRCTHCGLQTSEAAPAPLPYCAPYAAAVTPHPAPPAPVVVPETLTYFADFPSSSHV